MKRTLLAGFALALTAIAAIAANNMTFSTGTTFLPGPRLIDGSDLNVMVAVVNKLNKQADGSGPTLPACAVTGATPQTCNGVSGTITTGTLTTAAVTDAPYTINNSSVTAASIVQCTVQAYSGTYFTNGMPEIVSCVPGAGTIIAHIANTHATVALNGTVKVGFRVFN